MLTRNWTDNNECSSLGFNIKKLDNYSNIDDLGEQFVLSMAVLHLVMAAFGITGNILSLIVLVVEKKLHTVPNFYVGTLAVADLMICLLMPLSTIQFVTDIRIPERICNIVGYLVMLSLSGSLMSMVLIAVNRYILLVKGRSVYLKLYTKPRVVISLLVVFLWLILLVVVIPEAGLAIYGYSEKFHTCILRSYCFKNYIYVVAVLAGTVFLPANVIIGWGYTHVIYKLYKIWKKVQRREIKIRKISEALSENPELAENATSGVDINHTIDMELSSDESEDDDYDSEEEMESELQTAFRKTSSMQKGNIVENRELIPPPSSRRSSGLSGAYKDSIDFNRKAARRRSSCIPLPAFNLGYKFRKPQWRKRCAAITNMIAIYVMLWVCWTPLIIEFTLDIDNQRDAYFYHIEVTLMYLNSAFNILLYSTMNKSFRDAHKKFLCRCFKAKPVVF